MKRNFKSLVLVILISMAGFTVQAQTAKDIIQKYINKSGGIDKWKSVKTIVSLGNSSAMGQVFTFTRSEKAPNLNRVDVVVMGQTLVQAYDGKTAWTINPFQGSGKPEAMSAEVGKAFAENSQIVPVIMNLDASGLKANLLGKETLNGVTYDKIEVTHPEGDKDYYLFDSGTSLLSVVRKTPTTGQAAGKTAETFFSDYKDEQGMLVPHTQETKIDGQSFVTVTITSYKINTDVDSKIFDFPAEK